MTDDTASHDTNENNAEMRKELFQVFMKHLGNLGFTHKATDSTGKTILTETTLAKCSAAITRLLDTPLRQLLGTPPLSNTSNEVMLQIFNFLLDETVLQMQTISPEQEYTDQQLFDLASRMLTSLTPPHGDVARDLPVLAEFYSDIYDTIDLGVVSFPGQYDEVLIEHYEDDGNLTAEENTKPELLPDDEDDFDDLEDREPTDTHSYLDLIADEPLTLHPLAEAKHRINALRTRLHAQKERVFESGDSITVTDSDRTQKLAVLDDFANTLIQQFTQDIKDWRAEQHITSALELPDLRMGPKDYAHTFLKALLIASDPDKSPDDVAQMLDKESETYQQLLDLQRRESSPHSRIEKPVIYQQTITDHHVCEMDNPMHRILM